MDAQTALKIAYDNFTKPIDEIDLSQYSIEEKELIQKATYSIEKRVDALIEENLLERRGAF